jgi:GTP pyrophosphokinase
MIEGVTKIEKFNFRSGVGLQQKQAENFKKLLISISKDLRVLLIKLADRLHNVRTIQYLQKDKIKRICRETLEIYAPLANRFGVWKVKWELEDLAFKYLYPEEYKKIAKVVQAKKNDRDQFISRFTKPVEDILKKAGINASVSGRSKHFYSIYKKKEIRHVDYDELYDLAAIRIIVDSIEECYTTLGLIHAHFEPINRLRDYIAKPKPNNYQSIHTIVISEDKKKVEVQIRTKDMHYIAEEGIAAHWRYKEMKSHTDDDFRNLTKVKKVDLEFQNQKKLVGNLLNENEDVEGDDFIQSIKLNLFQDIIVVLTPNGDYIELPKGSTAIDFAFAIHTDVGLCCNGAILNDSMVPIRTKLKNGDVVKVKCSKTPHPSRDWLNYAVTSRARQKIRNFLRKKELEDAVELGKLIVTKRARKLHFPFKTEEDYKAILAAGKLNDLNTLYSEIGLGNITFDELVEIVRPNIIEDEVEPIEEISKVSEEHKEQKNEICIEDLDNLMLSFAKCCHPLPGDNIVGYTTRGRGITVHREDCKDSSFLNLKANEPERFLSLTWKENKDKSKLIRMRIFGEKNGKISAPIIGLLMKHQIDLQQINFRKSHNEVIGDLVFIKNPKIKIQNLKDEIMQIKHVEEIKLLN